MHTENPTGSVVLRAPRPEDGSVIWRLVRDGGSLDLNSPYLYLLICTDFAATSIVAVDADDVPVGFVAAYRPPDDPTAAFVWQVGVAQRARGQGLAKRLIKGMLCRHANRDTTQLTSTVTPSNEASMALFHAVARDLHASVEERERFGAELFPEGHEAEIELRIGPLAPRPADGAF